MSPRQFAKANGAFNQETKMFKTTIAAAALALVGSLSPAFADTTVHVFLWDGGSDMDMVENHKIGDNADRSADTMGVAASVHKIVAGTVTFDVLNSSADSEHEMVLSKLSGPDAILPYNPELSAVDEEAANSQGEVEGLEAGASGALTVDLTPGIYALYCNIPGHYAAGMWTLISVK